MDVNSILEEVNDQDFDICQQVSLTQNPHELSVTKNKTSIGANTKGKAP